MSDDEVLFDDELLPREGKGGRSFAMIDPEQFKRIMDERKTIINTVENVVIACKTWPDSRGAEIAERELTKILEAYAGDRGKEQEDE